MVTVKSVHVHFPAFAGNLNQITGSLGVQNLRLAQTFESFRKVETPHDVMFDLIDGGLVGNDFMWLRMMMTASVVHVSSNRESSC
jgi:hypothetical protein